jgi:hypothetical protein
MQDFVGSIDDLDGMDIIERDFFETTETEEPAAWFYLD